MIWQALADGIFTGAIIALGAIGVSFSLQILKFANFAHSELLTWGAYLALVVVAFAGPGTPSAHLSFGWQMLAAMAVAAAAAPEPLRNARRLKPELPGAFGAGFFMRGPLRDVWGNGFSRGVLRTNFPVVISPARARCKRRDRASEVAPSRQKLAPGFAGGF